MTVFWKPIGSRQTDPLARTKALGRGLYELWSRCDICRWSGPSYRTTLVERGDESINVCDCCGGDENLWRVLLADGWVAR